MATTRFIPVSICKIPTKVYGQHFDASDADVIADLNRRLKLTGYQVQSLDPEQFVTASIKPSASPLIDQLQEFVRRGGAAQRAIDRIDRVARPKSPIMIARAKKRVDRMVAKTKAAAKARKKARP